jgi:hypothetical protein
VSAPAFYRLRFARIAPLLGLLLLVLSLLHFAGVKHYVVSEDTGGLGRAPLAAILLDGRALARKTLRWSAAVGVTLLAFSLGFSSLSAAVKLDDLPDAHVCGVCAVRMVQIAGRSVVCRHDPVVGSAG